MNKKKTQKNMKVYAWPFLLAALLLTSFAYDKTQQASYHISDLSTLELQGSSNVAKFKCHCQCSENFGRGYIRYQYADNGYKITLNQSTMELRAKLLDCGHRGINKDMYSTLKADEYPEIAIQIKEVFLPEGRATLSECDNWRTLDAKADITIAGVTRHVNLKIKANQKEDGYYQFIAKKDILLSDFNLTPPSPMFGLIKVDDEIAINFDLHVEVL